MRYEKIDPNKWPRREIFDFFSALAYPFYMVSFNLEVTGLYNCAKTNGLSFYHCMIKLVTDAVNSVEAFRYALVDGSLVLLDERRPSFTHLDKGSELFRIITMPCAGDYGDFCREAKRLAERTTGFIDSLAEGPDLIYISCLPWLDMTALTNEHDLSGAVRDDSIPRIAWGKIKTEGEKKYLNISVEVNHRFIDGVHIGMLAQRMEKMINAL